MQISSPEGRPPLPGAKRTLGVIIPDLINPVHVENALRIERLGRSRGYSVCIENAACSPGREAEILEKLLAMDLCGLLVMSVSTETHRLYADMPVPTVLIGSRTEVPTLDYVALDDYHAAYLVVSRLADCGRKRVAFLSFAGAQGYSALDRMNGVRKAIKRSGDEALTVEIAHLPAEGLRDSCQATEKLLGGETPPNAIVAQNDYIAYGAMQAVNEAGLVPGRDVAVIGFDNLLYSSLPKMRLSTVAVMGQPLPDRAFSILERRLNGAGRSGRRAILLAPRLIFRNSFPGAPPC